MRMTIDCTKREFRRLLWGIAILLAILVPAFLIAQSVGSGITLPHNLQNGQIADADQVMANFRALADAIDSNNSRIVGLEDQTSTTIDVDCGAGQTVTQALANAHNGDTIRISGTCNETVTIDKNGITLDGQGSAVIDGGGGPQSVIRVKGHQNVTITGLTVQNGLFGIDGRDGAALTLHNVIAQNNHFSDDHTGGSGINLQRNTTGLFTGTIRSNNNDNGGIEISSGASARFNRTILVQTNGNGDRGIDVSTAASAFFFNVVAVEADSNANEGMRAARNGNVIFFNGSIDPIAPVELSLTNNGSDGAESGDASTMTFIGVNATISNNAGRGILAFNNGVVSFNGNFISLERPIPASTLLLENNTLEGLLIDRSSTFRNTNGVTITVQNNQAGSAVRVRNGSYAELRNIDVVNNPNGDGIRVENGGNITLNTATVSGNGGRGIFLFNGGLANLANVQISNHANAFAALFLNSHSSVTANNLTVTGNGDRGVSLDHHCNIILQTSTISNNGGHGLALYNGSSATLEDVQITNHTSDLSALTVNGNSSVASFSGGILVSNNAGVGIEINTGSAFDADGNTIMNNAGGGMQVDDGSVTISNSTLTSNGVSADLNATFGARLSLFGNTIGSIICDATVLSRGDTPCPA